MKRGFTLIELIAVIIILGLLAAIIIPISLSVIKNSKEKAYEEQINTLIEMSRKYVIENDVGYENNLEKIITFQDLKQNGLISDDSISNPKTNDKLPGCIIYKWSDSIKQYEFRYDEKCIVVSKYKDTILNGSDPELDEGMIPVYYEGNTLKKADISKEWYNYTNKSWANVVLVNDATIKDLPANTVIDESKILAYFVWIPRYKYAVPTGSGPRSISIVFENKTTSKSNGNAVDTNYLTHPAFTFGTTELNGIWIGKFETTGTGENPTIKPNLISLTNQNVSTQFATAQKFGTSSYGVSGVDAHMMKNTEWGATAYLSHSIYGINKEVRINNNNALTTGCGALTDDASDVSTCDIKYGNASDLIYSQSTTGNITGIYDMSGGTWEYVMGNYNNNIKYSGFSTMPEAKYFDLYTTSTGIKGDAIRADGTDRWYGDSSYFLDSMNPWFARGELYNKGMNGGVFSFGSNSANAISYYSFRSVLSRP